MEVKGKNRKETEGGVEEGKGLSKEKIRATKNRGSEKPNKKKEGI